MNKKIVLVTGGSSGLGYELAKKHVLLGDNVCVLGRSEERLKEAATNLQTLSTDGSVLSEVCNVADEESVKRVFSLLAEEGYRLSVVYNVAGVGRYSEPENVTKQMIDELLEANFIGLIVVSTQVLPLMKDNGGTIVNVMSSAAKKANPFETVYCGVKWGARGYTEALAAALKGSPIRVLAVYPGGMNTPFWCEESGLNPDVSKFMQPDEVAEAIISSVADRNSLKVTELSIDRK